MNTGESAMSRPVYKRKMKNYLLDVGLQLRYTATIVIVAIALTTILGIRIYQATRDTSKVILWTGLVDPATAQELHAYGSVLRVVPSVELRSAALGVARQIAALDRRVVVAAKESLNGIDPVDVKRSYRFEQGFTFELNLSGVSDESRDAFVDKRDQWSRDA